MSTVTSSSGAHILIFPYPAQGHMIPILDFAHQLSLHNLTVTVLTTPKNLPILNPLLSKNPSIKTLVLPFPGNPKIPPGIENAKDLSPTLIPDMMITMSKLYGPLLQWFKIHPSPPVAIISGFFLGWTQHLAYELNIPRIVFSTTCAMALSIIDLLQIGVLNSTNYDPCSFHQIPNSPTFPRWKILDSVTNRENLLANVHSWGVVFNSFTELESAYLDSMRRDLTGWVIITEFGLWDLYFLMLIPPLRREEGQVQYQLKIFSHGSINVQRIQWYVCFGSQAALPNKQMEALAAGLECSKVGLVEGAYSAVPAGFEKRMAGWVPQLLILRHPSVGSFMTHCGWNSTLEGLTSGVVMLAWPMMAEQFFNANLIVDQLKVAIRVCEGNEFIPNPVQLGELVGESMTEKRRLRARKLCKDLQSLLKDLRGLKILQ
ncbi:hypothetical protein MKX01_024405 [Papaver californicum]|nr:hypothetical protein MKX01_024405 [Papaver californicum]